MKNNTPFEYLTFSFISILLLYGCESNQEIQISSSENTWVFLELEKQMKNDTNDFYLYGEIKQTILNTINKNESSKGIFQLSNIRYINDQDLLQIYEDKSDKGIYLFRIEDIQTVRLLKADPILTFNDNELHEVSLNFKKRILAKEH